MNELDKAITAKDGPSHSIFEHDEIVNQIKSEATQAHEEMQKAMNRVPKVCSVIFQGTMTTKILSYLLEFQTHLVEI